MRGSDLAEAMASTVDWIVSAREGTDALDRAIEAIIGMIGWFSGKDATSYLASYRAEMLMPVRLRTKGEKGGGAAGSTRAFLEAARASRKPAKKGDGERIFLLLKFLNHT